MVVAAVQVRKTYSLMIAANMASVVLSLVREVAFSALMTTVLTRITVGRVINVLKVGRVSC